MKKQTRIFLPLIISVIFAFSSCSDEKGEYPEFISLVTVSDDGKSFTLDDSTKVLIVESGTISKPKYKRAIIYYSSVSGNYSGYDKGAKLFRIYSVLTKDIIYVANTDQAKQDSIGSDPVKIQSIWESGGYLNVKFSYLTRNETSHFTNLVSNKADLSASDAVVELQFRHNAKNDYPGYPVNSYACFDLKPYLTNKNDTITFKVTTKESSAISKTFEIKYKPKK